jgi:hypothetical protein
MTTYDKIVGADLAALGIHSRQRLLALDETLRAVSARAARARARAASRAPESGALTMFSLEAIYAQRVARAAAGAMGILCTAVLLLALYAPAGDGRHVWMVWSWILDGRGPVIALGVGAVMLVAYSVGGSIARRRFVRALERTSIEDARSANERAEGLLRSIDGPSVTLAVGGFAGPAVLVAAMTWLVGWAMWSHTFYVGLPRPNGYYSDHDFTRAPFLEPLHGVSALIAGIVLAAVALGWVCTRRRGSDWVRALARRHVVPAGAVLAVAAASVTLSFGVEPLRWYNDHNIPGGALRAPVMVAGAIAAFLIAAGGALWLRRRELDRLDDDPRAEPRTRCVEPVLLALGDMFRQRIARMAGGGIALAYTLTLLIVIHDPFGVPLLRDTMGPPGFHWTQWFVSSRTSGPVLAVVLVVAAQLLAARLGDRAFARRVQRLAGDDFGRSSVDLGRRLVQRLDVASVTAGIAGVASLGALFAVVGMTVGDSTWVFLQVHGPRVGKAVSAVLRDCELASGLAAVAALAVGVACAREAQGRRSRWLGMLAHRAIVPLGVVLGVAAGVIGMTMDFGVFDISLPAVERPPLPHELGVVVMATAAAVLVTTGHALRRRRAEHARLES